MAKLDELVALHILEWRREGSQWIDPLSGVPAPLPSFSQDLMASWAVVDRICEKGYRLQLDGSRIWQARFYKSAAHTLETKAYSATSKTPAEAICRAALAVQGIALDSKA